MQSVNSVHSCTTGAHILSKNVGPHQNCRCQEHTEDAQVLRGTICNLVVTVT